MQVREWTVCIIEPNKFDAQIMVDILRNAGVERIQVVADAAIALEGMSRLGSNIIIAAHDSTPMDGVTWTRQFRRTQKLLNRRAPIFITARALSKAVAEECRHGGANAVIIKPLSSQTLIGTINKVLSAPREFIDAAGYVGPCRRAGIITTDAPKRRRGSDAAKISGLDINLVQNFKRAVEAHVAGRGDLKTCSEALTALQANAATARDGPMLGACAAFAILLDEKRVAPGDILLGCLTGVLSLVDGKGDARQREDVAERVRQAVAKVALQRAA